MSKTCDIQVFTKFLQLLTKNDSKHPTPLICSQQLPDSKNESAWSPIFWHLEDLDALFDKLARRNIEDRRSVSVATNEFGLNNKPLVGDIMERKIKQVSRIRCFVIDCDTYIDELTLTTLIDVLAPSFVTVSSARDKRYKTHMYFRIAPGNELFESKMIEYCYAIQKALAYCTDKILATLLNIDIPDGGWCDMAVTPDKAYRSPGFWHTKDTANPFKSRLIECDGEDVSEDNFSEFLSRFDCTSEIIASYKKRTSKNTSYTTTASGEYAGANRGERHTKMYEWVSNYIRDFRPSHTHMSYIAEGENSKNIPPFGDDPEDTGEEVAVIVDNAYKAFERVTDDRILRQINRGNVICIRRRLELKAEKLQLLRTKKITSLEAGPEIADIMQITDAYKYASPEYTHPLSDIAITKRIHDAFGHHLKHSIATGMLTYTDSAGVWDTEIGKKIARDYVSTVISNMEHEPIVREQFPPKAPDVNVQTKEEKEAQSLNGPDYNKQELANYICNNTTVNRLNSITDSLSKHIAFNVDHAALDSEPDLLNAKNGIIELTTGKILAHDPAKLFTAQTSTMLDPNRVSKLKDMQGKNEWLNARWSTLVLTYCNQDVELARFLQVLLGVSLYGNVKEQVCSTFLGGGANGKSTILEIPAAALGTFAQVVPQSFVCADKFKNQNVQTSLLAQLRRVRYVVVDDMAENAVYDEAFIKNITNGGMVTARRLGKDPFEIMIRFMIFLQSNHRPKIVGTDYAIWRRMIATWFNYRIPEDMMDGSFKTTLTNDQQLLNYVLDWLVGGAVRYADEGLIIPSSVTTVTQDYRNTQQPLLSFIGDCFDYEPSKANALSSIDAFDAYVWWKYTIDDDFDVASMPTTPKGFGKVVKRAIEQTFDISYTAKTFRTSTTRLMPVRLKSNSFTKEFLSEEVQSKLTQLRRTLAEH